MNTHLNLIRLMLFWIKAVITLNVKNEATTIIFDCIRSHPSVTGKVMRMAFLLSLNGAISVSWISKMRMEPLFAII